MSARLQRRGQRALAFVALTLLAAVTPSTGQAQQITLSAGDGSLTSVAPNSSFGLPIHVDMSQAGGENIASLTGSIIWDPARLTFQSLVGGPFGSLITNETQVGSGLLTFSLFSPTGTTNTFDALTINFQAGATGVVVITPQVQAAGNDVGADITSLMRVAPLELCIGTGGGLWGDVTGDGQVNIIDAQQIARFSVGLPVGNPTLMAALGDVTSDGQVNIIDAQQIARFSVGLPAAARIGTVSPGSCTAPSQAVLDLTPTSLAFTAAAGANPIPDNQRFQIQNNGSVFMQYTISDNAAWLTTSRTSGPLSPGDRIFIDAIVSSNNLAVGQYNATITVSDPGAVGSPKTVDVSLNVVAPCNTLDGSVGVGGSVAGALDNQDCQIGNSTYADRWELTLNQAANVQINLTGSTLGDPFLYLTTVAATDPTDPGQAAEVIAINDDANASLNSEITVSLAAGTYIIWATAFPFPSFSTGAYDLSVTALAAEELICLTSNIDQFEVISGDRTSIDAGGATASFSAFALSGNSIPVTIGATESWLSPSPLAGITPVAGTFEVFADPALPSGTYVASIEPTAAGATLSDACIAQMRVLFPEIVNLSPAPQFNAVLGDPTAGTIDLIVGALDSYATRPLPVGIDVAYTSGPSGWLSASIPGNELSHIGPNSLTLTTSTAALPIGTHTAEVTVFDPLHPTVSTPAVIPVSITVTDPPPTVVLRGPAPGFTDITIEAVVTVEFSEPMDPTSINASTFELIGPSGPVSGQISYSGVTAIFFPDSPLDEFATTYTVQLRAGIQTPSGNALVPEDWSFTTALVDPAYYYRLHSELTGPGFVLDNFASVPPTCHMAPANPATSGSFWYFEKLSTGSVPGQDTYLFKSIFGGPSQALDGGSGPSASSPCLLNTFGAFPHDDQEWYFVPSPPANNTFVLQNANWLNVRSLEAGNAGSVPEAAFMGPTNFTPSQTWVLTRMHRR